MQHKWEMVGEGGRGKEREREREGEGERKGEERERDGNGARKHSIERQEKQMTPTTPNTKLIQQAALSIGDSLATVVAQEALSWKYRGSDPLKVKKVQGSVAWQPCWQAVQLAETESTSAGGMVMGS